MPNYDFLNLSPFDFEELTRDLLQKYYDIYLESFTTGRDGGIDLRYSKEKNNDLIVQCKSYNNYSSLKSNLKKECQKAKTLNPQKYVLSTSVGLTPLNKDEIIKIFNGYIKSPSDIFGKDDLNNLLGQFSEIEKKHFKLWFSSTNILQKLLSNDIISRSEFEEEKIRKEINIYVQNDTFKDAINILNNHNYVLISGIPGIGKTTLARILIFNYLLKDYELVVVSSDINEAESLYERGKKQLFYYDDFLGRNFLEERLEKNEDQRLVRFIEKIKSGSNKKLIMTTREYILNQAKLKYEIFANSNLEIAKCIIDLEKYSKLIRAEILYNHLFYSNLPPGYIYALLIDRSYLKIIYHPNYSPRIIQFMTDIGKIDSISEREFLDFFIRNLDNPINIWKHSFENQISKSSKYLLYTMLVFGDPIYEQYLEKSFWEFYTNESKKFNFKIKREDFINSVKELENTFIKVSKDQNNKIYSINRKDQQENLIQFQNPSIRDFLINKVRNNINLISSLIDNTKYLNQLFHVYTINSKHQPYKIPLNNDLASKLINKIIHKFESLESIEIRIYSGNANKNYLKAEKLSDIQKLHKIASFLNPQKYTQIRNFIISQLSKLENKDNINWNDKNFLIDLLIILKKDYKIEDKKYIAKSFSSIEQVEDISNLIKIKNYFPKLYRKLFNEGEDREEMKEKIIEVVNLEIDSISMDTKMYIGYAEELKSNLEEFEKSLEINFQEEIMDLEAIIAEEIDNINPDDHLEDEYPRNCSHNNEEKIIEDMFDSLK
jgi:hypothetical protein